MIFFKMLIEMISHFVLMVIIMVAGVGGVNGFDLRAVGGLSNFFGIFWVNSVFQVDNNFTTNLHFLSEESVAK